MVGLIGLVCFGGGGGGGVFLEGGKKGQLSGAKHLKVRGKKS